MDTSARYYQNCNLAQPDLVFNDANDEITTIELWCSRTGSPAQWSVLKIHGMEKDAWVSADATRPDRLVLLQLLQVRLSDEVVPRCARLDISRDNFETVITKFGLHDILAYGQSSVQVFGQVSEKEGDDDVTYTAVHIADYFALFHKSHRGTGLTQGILWAQQRVLPFLHNAIVQHCTSANHPFFLNLCTAMAFDIAITSRLSSTSELIAGVERRTGFKIWDLNRFRPVEGSYSAVSATTSGYATSLAANRRLNKLTKCILTSFKGHTSAQSGAIEQPKQHQVDLMASRVDLLLQQNEVQLILIDFLTTRVQNQLTALFNLIAQQDTQITISLAKDSRTIATASKHDSTSMKTLAAVTVIFLPGTFIASLFSTTLFDWRAHTNTSVLSDRFWIYWLVTVPLTAATVAAWLLWTRREAMLYRDQEAQAQAERIQRMGEAT